MLESHLEGEIKSSMEAEGGRELVEEWKGRGIWGSTPGVRRGLEG